MKTHWKKLQNPDYLGAYSLDNGEGKYADIVATIATVRVENIVGADGKREDCMVARFTESLKPMIVNTTNAKTLEKLFKTPYIEEWSNRKIQIGVEKVKAFGDVVDALRIRKFFPQIKSDELVKCADCGNEITSTDKMTGRQIADYAQRKFGRSLCAECMRKLTEKPAETEGADASNE